MNKFIKLLEPELDYISHKILDDTIIIVASNKTELGYPYCENHSSKKHSFHNLPIMKKEPSPFRQNH